MFKLSYKIESSDIAAENKRIALFYFILYMSVAAVGIAVGATATALAPTTLIFVSGVALLVLGAILTVCAVLLMLTPKNFVSSALIPSDAQRIVTVDAERITVSSDESSDIAFECATVVKSKLRKSALVLYLDKNTVIIVKNAFVGEGSLEKLRDLVMSRSAVVRSSGESAADARGGADGSPRNDDAAQPADAVAAEENTEDNL